MSSTVQPVYGTANQAITLTLTSLGSGNAQQSTAIDNTTSLFTDARVAVKVKTNATGTAATGTVSVYGYGTADGGTTYTDGVAGSNGSVTLNSPTNLKFIGLMTANANATTYVDEFLVGNAFGGCLPQKWGVVVVNNSGAVLDASVGSAWYQGLNYLGT